MKIKSVPIGAIKAGPEDGLKDGEFVVYPSTFIRKPDSYGDVVAKGAFLDTIAEWKASGNTLPALYGHRMDDPDYFVGGAIDMSEDDHGWRVKGAFDLESPKGDQVYRLVKGRRLNQLSFAFDVLDEGSVELEDGQKANELRKLRVYEFSFVPIGANQDTSVVAVKSLTDKIADAATRGATFDIDSLRKAQETIGAALALFGDGSKATAGEPVNDDEPELAKSDEPMHRATVDLSAMQAIELAAICGD